MRKLSPPVRIWAAVFVATLPSLAVAQGKPLTLDQTLRGGVRFVPRKADLKWGPEGKLVLHTLRDAEGRGRREARDPATWEQRDVPAAAAEVGPEEAAEGRRVRPQGGQAEVASKDGVSLKRRRLQGDYLLSVPGAKPRIIGKNGEREVHLSPDHKRLSLVRDHNLVISDLAGSFEWSVSTDGSERLLYGYLDWVYQEEVYGRGDFQGHWWSPNSQHLAYLRIEESDVKTFTVIDHIPESKLADERSVRVETTLYPKSGDPNPTVRLAVAHPAAKAITHVDLSKYAEQEFLIVRVGWAPDASRLVFQVQDRIQTWLDLNFADPKTGAMQTVLHERSDTWVNVLGTPRWLADGSFLWMSERDGYQHIYRHAADGQLMNAVSHGAWPVSEILRVDETLGLIWFAGNKQGQIGSYAYRVKLNGSEQVCLTEDAGTHAIELNHDGSFFIDEYSNVDTPTEVRVCGADGEVLKEFAATPSKEMTTYAFSAKKLLRIEARDGFILDATLIKPLGMDESKSHPIWLDTYSGPNAPSVRNAWNYSAWHQFLAQQGVLVLQVNVRSASGRGQVTTGTCYQQFGVQELEDLQDAVAKVASDPWADASRVGINGWSYGGFMAAFALTHSDSFRLGVAGAGVYDWQLYDTIYTERYMSTPQANPAGYAASSCLEAAKDLSGHLLLLHGTMDDNVHFQNTVRFVYELQKAGKDFDLMFYPKSRHGVRSSEQRRHMRKLIWRQIQEHLLGES